MSVFVICDELQRHRRRHGQLSRLREVFDLFALERTTLCGSLLDDERIDKITMHFDGKLIHTERL